VITDAQVHLFEPDTAARPWPRDPDRMAPPRPGFSAIEMLAAMDAIGVDRAVIVPPVWAGDENDSALAAAAERPERFAVMGRFDPFQDDALGRLEQFFGHPQLLGFRMSGRWRSRPAPFLDALQDGSLDGFFVACERLGVPLMCLTLQCPEVLGPVAKRYPKLTLIVDHMAGVGPPSSEGQVAVLQALLDLAAFPNVAVKVSGAPNRSQEAFPYRDMHPVLEAVYARFGPERLMWAADFTQLTKNTYSETLRLWQEGLPFLSGRDRDLILGATVARLLKWPEPAAR
jgi:predicted TIM-barrel fold metal-dependent hydrolase